jgi:tRNA (cmo5U34)-methyltransferase
VLQFYRHDRPNKQAGQAYCVIVIEVLDILQQNRYLQLFTNSLHNKDLKTVTIKNDSIYAAPLQKIIDFQFDERVAAVFPDMIQRSVPGYGLIISNIGILAAKYAQAWSHCYDLGCSLGAATLAMRQRITAPDCDIISVDNSPAMIERARELLALDTESNIPVTMLCSDLQDVTIENASVVVLNFTLQFIPLRTAIDADSADLCGAQTGRHSHSLREDRF